MRTIKFRAKDLFNEWVYGSLITDKVENDNGKFMVAFIAPNIPCVSNGRDMWTARMKMVKPETVGQFTGLLDKNNKEIYEGDIVKVTSLEISTFGKEMKATIVYDNERGCYDFLTNDRQRTISNTILDAEIEVIGNIHDNPELINK